MKIYTLVAFLAASSTAVKITDEPNSITSMMDEILGNTVFSRDHNLPKDRAFLTSVLRKYSVLGNDSNDDINGKRVLTDFNGKWAARDILREWKGLNGEDLDNFIESDNFKKIFKEFDY